MHELLLSLYSVTQDIYRPDTADINAFVGKFICLFTGVLLGSKCHYMLWILFLGYVGSMIPKKHQYEYRQELNLRRRIPSLVDSHYSALSELVKFYLHNEGDS